MSSVFYLKSEPGSKSLKNPKISGFVLPHYENDLKVWELRGRGATFLKNDDIQISQPSVIFFEKKSSSKIQSDKAVYLLKSRVCQMSGNVVGDQNGFAFSTKKAEVHLKKRVITMPDIFFLKSSSLNFSSREGAYDLGTGLFKSKGKTQFIFKP